MRVISPTFLSRQRKRLRSFKRSSPVLSSFMARRVEPVPAFRGSATTGNIERACGCLSDAQRAWNAHGSTEC
eukprot:6205361-Pleurochrysis_carterae.AAC.3